MSASDQRKGSECLTSTRLDELVNLLAEVHGGEIKGLDNRTSLEQLGSVVGRRSKLLDVLATNASGGLLAPDDGAISKIALDEKDHLVVTHEHVVGADVVQPALHGSLDTYFVLVGTSTGSRDRRRNGGDKSVGVGRDQVVGKLDKLRVGASDVAELGGAELWQVCLSAAGIG
jgi:hypothetical protein